MAGNANEWYFTREQLDSTPSRKLGYDSLKELSYRQQTANFIQDMGQKLKVSQLCINTAIVYMHRFYVFHSFTQFPWHQMAAAALFLAAKVEEQPRKLEYVIRVATMCRNNKETIDITSEKYIAQSQDLVFNENALLQTLGFDVAIDHPHTHVVRCCHLVRASKDLAQTSYFLASNSLHLTTMCLQYKPTVVACFCIHLACKWSRWEIPLSTERKEWFMYVDPTVTADLLGQLTEEFLAIFESCPSRLKEKIMSIGDTGLHNNPTPIVNSPFATDPKKLGPADPKETHSHRPQHDKTGSESDPHKHRSSRPHEGSSSSQMQREREYREKKEREKLAQQHGLKPPPSGLGSSKQPVPHGHHRPVDPKLKPHSRQPSGSGHPPGRVEPKDILREAAKDSAFGIATKDFKDMPREHKDPLRSDKRDYLLKPNAVETNNAHNFGDAARSSYNGDKRADPNRISSRSSIDPNRIPGKHETVRRHEEKPSVKPETDGKKHSSANSSSSSGSHNAYVNKTINSTSQKVKSPFTTTDTSKSVPKVAQAKPHHHNGSTNGNWYALPRVVKEEFPVKGEFPDYPAREEYVKKGPGLFSPEKSPEHKLFVTSVKTSPGSQSSVPVIPLSPLPSPESKRIRNYSTGSEPELRPVMKKIDQVEGFENLMRDSTIGIDKLHQVPDIITPIADKEKPQEPAFEFSKEMRPPDIIPPLSSDNISAPLVNGIETNPVLISSLLKEAPKIPHLPVVANIVDVTTIPKEQEVQPQSSQLAEVAKEHHHHKSKKKNKEKHKHKDKDKSKDDKEKKKKHKDKDRERHKHKEKEKETVVQAAEPIKIKIHKDKIQPVVKPAMPLKIKILKDVIKTEPKKADSAPIAPVAAAPPPPIGLKIKIPKDMLNNCNSGDAATSSSSSNSSSSSKKRDRDRSSPGGYGPPAKMSRSSSHRDSKPNGRHSYNKVSTHKPRNVAPPPPRAPAMYQNNPPTTINMSHMYTQQAQNPTMYFFPPPGMQTSSMSVMPPTHPAYMYPNGQMYAPTQYYNTGFMYSTDMYQRPPPPMPPSRGPNPPLPLDAPPPLPPGPPPE